MYELFPGPLTIVVPRYLAEDKLPVDVLSLGYKTYGFRAPYYPPLWPIIEAVGGMLFATSANFHGKPSPKSIEEVDPLIRDQVDFILDGGNCPLGHASTVAIMDKDEWEFTRKLPRIPRLYVEWQPQTHSLDERYACHELNAIECDNKNSTVQPSEVDSDVDLMSEYNDSPFWSEPSLTSLNNVGRIIYKNTTNLTSSQRDMLSALAAWSRVTPI